MPSAGTVTRAWLLASAVATAAILIAFAADTSAPGAGILQRIAVTIPLVAIAAIAVRLLWSAHARALWPVPRSRPVR